MEEQVRDIQKKSESTEERLSRKRQKIRYISTEHPKVTYLNKKHAEYFNLTAKRYGRATPFYYVDMLTKLLIPLNNNFKVDIYFYEFLTNQYKRGFVEMHFKFCDLVQDKFFGPTMRQGNLTGPCPYPPGIYHLYNMSIPVEATPRVFPFTKGRIYCNVTYKNDTAGMGYIDMEVKEFNLKTRMNPKGLITLP